MLARRTNIGKHKVLELAVRRLEIIIDNNLVVNTGIRILNLVPRLVQSSLDIIFSFSATSPKALLKNLETRRSDEDIASCNGGICFHLLHALHFNIQYNSASFGDLICNRPFGRAVLMSSECRVFHKGPLGDELRKCFVTDKEVVFAFDFADSRCTSCVGYRKREGIGMLIDKLLSKGSFPDARGSGDDDWFVIYRGLRLVLVVNALYGRSRALLEAIVSPGTKVGRQTRGMVERDVSCVPKQKLVLAPGTRESGGLIGFRFFFFFFLLILFFLAVLMEFNRHLFNSNCVFTYGYVSIRPPLAPSPSCACRAPTAAFYA